MDGPLVPMLLTLAAGLALAAVGVHFYRRIARWSRAREARRIRGRLGQVEAKGWRLEPVAEGSVRFRIHGKSGVGIAWEMHYDSDSGSSTASPKLVWRAVDLNAPHAEFWSTGVLAARMLKSGAGNMAMRIAGQIGSVLPRSGLLDFSELIAAGRTHTPRSAVLRERIVVMCRDPARCARIFDDEVERLLLSFPAGSTPRVDAHNVPAVQFGPGGLEVRIGNRDGQMAVIEHLVLVGAAIAERIKGRSTF